MRRYEAVVIGVSAGGLFALTTILSGLPRDFSLPVIIVQHRSREETTLLEEVISHKCLIRVKQADEKEAIAAGAVYFAPPDYHLLIEHDRSFSLSVEAPLNYSRPGMRGRTIWGGLVPWNQVWRTGANNPTAFTTTRDITIGGVAVPAGSYTLTSISTQEGTKLIIGSGAGDNVTEVARVDLVVSQLATPVEKFTIAVEPGQGNRATLALSWDRRRMTAPIVVR